MRSLSLSQHPNYRWLLLSVAWMMAVNLRAGVIGVSLVLPLIRTDLGLTFAQAGFLFSTPMAMMALFGVPGGYLVDRVGPLRVITLGMGLVVVGGLARSFAGGYGAILMATVVFGAGVGIAQTALPPLVRSWFADRVATATGIYTSGMLTGAGLSAAIGGTWLLTVSGDWSWRGSLLAWGILALVALAMWLAVTRSAAVASTSAGARSAPIPTGAGSAPTPAAAGPAPTPGRVLTTPAPGATGYGAARSRMAASSWYRSRTAWLVALFFSLQSVSFYIVSSWLPSYYVELGWSIAAASGPMAVFQLVQIPSSLLVAYTSDRFGLRRPFLLVASGLVLVCLVGLLWLPIAGAYAWVVPMGLGFSTCFALGMALPVDVARRQGVGSLTGMVLTVGYGGTMVGPSIAGLLRDHFGTLQAGFAFALALAVLMMFVTILLPETGEGRQEAATAGD